MKRVLVVSPSTATRGQPAQLAKIREGELAQVKFAGDIQFDFRPARVAPPHWDNWHDLLLADLGLFEAGMDAQAEGYDAVCLETVSDSGLEALRAVLDILVLAPGKCSYMTALMLGKRFSILTVTGAWRLLYERKLREYGLEHRCASIRGVMTPDEVDYADVFGGKESRYFPVLIEQATRCIEDDGADVIVLGSTTMYQAGPYLAERMAVPVVNPSALVFRLVELVLDLGLTLSRRAYRKPEQPLPEIFHAMLDAAAGRSS